MIMNLFKNAKIILENEILNGDLLTADGKIVAIGDHIENTQATVIDCKGGYLSPGFADIHVHGGGGYSAMSKNADEIVKMCEAHAFRGTTSIVPTTLAAPVKQLQDAIDTITDAMKVCPMIRGIHLEGPFLSMKMKGAQSPDNILPPTEENYTALLDYSDKIVMMGAAPELDGAFSLGEEMQKRGIVASVAHSDASYEIAEEALEHGFSDVTHLYSACSAMHKEGIFRQVGVVEAALANDGYTTQFIADLRHLPAGALKLIYKAKGADRAYCITDGLEYAATDMEEGTVIMQENGLSVVYEDQVMKLADRSCLAGSVATSNVLVRNLWKTCAIPLTDVIKMAATTPLKVIGQDTTKGRIAIGYDADLVVFDEDVNVQFVCVGERIIRNEL